MVRTFINVRGWIVPIFLFSLFLLFFETMKKEHEWKPILFSNLLYVNYGLSVPFKQCLNILKCFCTKLFISSQAIKQHRGTYSKPYLREKPQIHQFLFSWVILVLVFLIMVLWKWSKTLSEAIRKKKKKSSRF